MPLPVGVEEKPGQPKAIQMPYVKICNQNATWYEGADLPLMSLSQRNPEGVVQADYWVSLLNSKTMAAIVQYGRENQVAGYSYLPINYDDGPNRCGNGNWPLLSYLHLLMNKIPARVEPKITDKAKLQEICQVVSKYCQGL
ncbi:hypothetical protein HDE_03948 [Halotydeus destructor]|nr:hypothetical protein HDE_03948 [Halotydeus destructor]